MNDFSFDDEIIQNAVFFSIEKHEIVTNVDFRDNDENRVLNSSRQIIIEKKFSSLFSTFFLKYYFKIKKNSNLFIKRHIESFFQIK